VDHLHRLQHLLYDSPDMGVTRAAVIEARVPIIMVHTARGIQMDISIMDDSGPRSAWEVRPARLDSTVFAKAKM
jgi:hypothetical protein